MLKRFLEQQQAICAMLLEDGDNRTLMPSTDEIATMEELVEILKHFYQATEILSGELYPTIGVVFPILNRFLTVLLVSDCNDKDIAKKIKEKIKQDLITRYQNDEIENVLYIYPCTWIPDSSPFRCFQSRKRGVCEVQSRLSSQAQY